MFYLAIFTGVLLIACGVVVYLYAGVRKQLKTEQKALERLTDIIVNTSEQLELTEGKLRETEEDLMELAVQHSDFTRAADLFNELLSDKDDDLLN
jgi:multidrug efflux pump subunit AcrB